MALIHLDAGVVIGFLDANDGHHRAATEALGDSLQSGDDLAVAASAFAECLVGPSRRGVDAVRVVTDLFERLPIRVVDLGEDVALRAAALRAKHGALRLPDALVIATAVCDGAHRLITTDRRWPTARKLGLARQEIVPLWWRWLGRLDIVPFMEVGFRQDIVPLSAGCGRG